MNILVISYFFAPHTKIAAVRWTKLSKYLSEAGVSVDVITSEAMGMTDELLLKDCSRLNKIFRVEHGDDRFNAGLSDSVSRSARSRARRKASLYLP